MAEPRTGPKFGQKTFKCNICSDLPIEPQDQHQPIHRVPVNGSSMIVRFFFSKARADRYCS